MASPLYPTHVPLSTLQKAAVALLSGVGALVRPARADLVAAFGETTGFGTLHSMRDRMRQDPTGRTILDQRPRITNESVAPCWDMPDGSFGRAYADFMDLRGFQADERPPVRFVDDEELAYVAARYREVHDFWHVLFGCPTTVSGELALKALEFVQTGLPMTALAVAGAQWKLPKDIRDQLMFQHIPWAVRAGLRSRDLMCIHYERHYGEQLQDLRKHLRIIRAPSAVRR